MLAGLGVLVKGRLKRGLYLSLGSRVSVRTGSFSEIRSGGAEGEEAKGLRVRIGMFLVLQLRLATGGLRWYRAGVWAAMLCEMGHGDEREGCICKWRD